MLRRKSKQRDRIYKILTETDSHPTAKWVYDKMKKKYPGISLGNVYRNLNILVEDGLVKKREFDDVVDHYDAVTEQHYHFVCEKCRRISDIDVPVQSIIEQIARQRSEMIITGHTISFYGICSKCKDSCPRK